MRHAVFKRRMLNHLITNSSGSLVLLIQLLLYLFILQCIIIIFSLPIVNCHYRGTALFREL